MTIAANCTICFSFALTTSHKAGEDAAEAIVAGEYDYKPSKEFSHALIHHSFCGFFICPMRR